MKRLQEILSLLKTPEQIEDEDIAKLEEELQEMFDEIRKGDQDEETVETLVSVADAVDDVRLLGAVRWTDAVEAAAEEQRLADEREAKIKELEDRVKGSDEDEDQEDDEDSDVDAKAKDGDDDDSGNGDDGDDEDDESGDDEDDDKTVDEELDEILNDADKETDDSKEKEPVVASLKDMKKRQPKKFHAQPKRHAPRVKMFSAGTAGAQFASRIEVEDELLDTHRRLAGGSGPSGRVKVASFSTEFPSDRVLPERRVTDANDLAAKVRRAAQVTDPNDPESLAALTADGGICGPVNVWYDLENISQASRPLRDSLVNYNANRGGIQWDDPMTIADIVSDDPNGAIGSMTEAQDAAGETDKTFQMIECGEHNERTVEAVWRQLQFGRFVQRSNPERVSHFTDLSIAAYARYSEQRLFAKMVADSTPAGSVQEFGALRDLLRNINRSATNYRNRHRMPRDATIRVDLPSWVVAMLQDDMTAALNSEMEMLNLTLAQITSYMATRNVRVVWRDDEFTGAQAGGASLNAYPASFTYLLGHEGGWFYLDNGTLDLGIITDTVTATSNNFRTFVEEFWNIAYLGIESLAVTASFCPSGASAGSLDPVCGS